MRSNMRYSLRNRYACEIGTIFKCTVSDMCHSSRNGYACKAGTVTKRRFPNLCHTLWYYHVPARACIPSQNAAFNRKISAHVLCSFNSNISKGIPALAAYCSAQEPFGAVMHINCLQFAKAPSSMLVMVVCSFSSASSVLICPIRKDCNGSERIPGNSDIIQRRVFCPFEI